SVPIHGVVDTITFKGVHYEIIVDVDGFKWMIQTTDYAEVGKVVGLRILPEEIHVMKNSKYSNLYGDYSTYFDELDIS
ncbi:MAG: spermidine/putrescine ABC transporter ATP-binding protein, partial [Clostridia bacterium]|nr:spermidine/putrescine ABC transporter ATP-binding protein [Clostridia bacterium]